MRITAFIVVFFYAFVNLGACTALENCGINTASSKCKIVPCTSKAFACLDSPGETWTCAMCALDNKKGPPVTKDCKGVYADDQKHPLVIDKASKSAVLYAPKESWALSERRLYRRISDKALAVCATVALGGLLYLYGGTSSQDFTDTSSENIKEVYWWTKKCNPYGCEPGKVEYWLGCHDRIAHVVSCSGIKMKKGCHLSYEKEPGIFSNKGYPCVWRINNESSASCGGHDGYASTACEIDGKKCKISAAWGC